MRHVIFALAVMAAPAWAQSPVRIHGTVLSATPDRLLVASEDGTLTVALPADLRIGAVADRSLDSIRPGEFVGSAAVRGRDGQLHAQEVHTSPRRCAAPARGIGQWASRSRA